MRRRITAAAFREIRKRPGVLAASCALRRAVRHTPQCRENAPGVVVVIVDKEWIPRFERAAELLISGQHRAFFRAETSRHQVISFETGSKRRTDIDVLRANAQTIVVTDSHDALPYKVKLAADAIVVVEKPTARHVMAVRKLTGRPQVRFEIAEKLVEQDWATIDALLCRQSLDGVDFGLLSAVKDSPAFNPVKRLSEIPGLAPVREWASELAIDIAAWRAGRLAWSNVDRAALLIGPPGVGKTMCAGGLAAELGIPLIATSAGQWQSSKSGYLGDMLRAMRASFEEARSKTNAILFVDELDSIGNRAHHGNNIFYESQVVNTFLELCSVSAGWQGFILLGATNRVGDIDPAVLRAGRFEKHIVIDTPSAQERAAILSHHLDGFDAERLRRFTDVLKDSTPAELERLSRAIKRLARNESRDVELQDVEKSMPSRVTLSDEALQRVAVHEVGHAIVAIASGWVTHVDVSLSDTLFEKYEVQSAGQVQYEFKDSLLPTEDFLRAQIRIALAGLAAEMVGIGNRATGGAAFTGSDLDVATGIAKQMVVSFGMGRIPRFYASAAKASSEFWVPPSLSAEVDGILMAEWKNAMDMLTAERSHLMSLAANLVAERNLILTPADI
ncbi:MULTISPECIES: AAA family ATPase [unclassified Rhizobium]|uniref:AAA family ATPase n=1 Tax=unclassified Rhizobium TaxID=2613769 RepID=UPI001C82C4F1|nr:MULTISPECIES: AAA family ATPase [unclassified Rhizobium]MBX5167011.1 AAA family ATPase [Rhizobium sp. NZLR4b]MBX5211158.1 AAA family ATPase [Rhizobium sp. NZLR11]